MATVAVAASYCTKSEKQNKDGSKSEKNHHTFKRRWYIENNPNIMDLKRQFNYCKRKSKVESVEEGGVKVKKKNIRALRDRARYLENNIAIAKGSPYEKNPAYGRHRIS